MSFLRLFVVALFLFGVPLAATCDALWPEWLDGLLGRTTPTHASGKAQVWAETLPRRLPPVDAISPAPGTSPAPLRLPPTGPAISEALHAPEAIGGPDAISPKLAGASPSDELARLQGELQELGARGVRVHPVPGDPRIHATCVMALPQNPAYAREFAGSGVDEAAALRELVRVASAWRQAQAVE